MCLVHLCSQWLFVPSRSGTTIPLSLVARRRIHGTCDGARRSPRLPRPRSQPSPDTRSHSRPSAHPHAHCTQDASLESRLDIIPSKQAGRRPPHILALARLARHPCRTHASIRKRAPQLPRPQAVAHSSLAATPFSWSARPAAAASILLVACPLARTLPPSASDLSARSRRSPAGQPSRRAHRPPSFSTAFRRGRHVRRGTLHALRRSRSPPSAHLHNPTPHDRRLHQRAARRGGAPPSRAVSEIRPRSTRCAAARRRAGRCRASGRATTPW